MNHNIPVKTQFAVKEFFLKSHCMRNEEDGCTMIYAEVSRSEVLRCQQDFKAEASRLVNICARNRKMGDEAAITNHHIVPVNECFDANGTSYFVMEFLNGGSLRSRVKENGVMSEVQALSFIRPIVDAVEFIHKNKVLHMDIKPENIVMRSGGDSQPDVPMLIDFGISLHFDDKGARTTLSNSSGLTPGYSPMEQAQPITTFDSRIDVYSLAATTFYLLTGKDPINSADVNETYIRSELPATVSERTRNAIVHAMQPLRQFRTPTAADFLRELAASYTLPVGFVLEGPFDNYRITRIMDDCGSYIRYEARRASENRNTTDLHSTQRVSQDKTSSQNKQSIVVLEQFVNGISIRNDDNSVTLGLVDELHNQRFESDVAAITGLTDIVTLPAIARGRGGLIEAMCFDSNGTCYCVANSSFKPQSALVKSISNVADGATQVVGEVTQKVKTNYRLLAGIIVAGCIIGAAVVYVPKLFKSSNNATGVITDSVAASDTLIEETEPAILPAKEPVDETKAVNDESATQKTLTNESLDKSKNVDKNIADKAQDKSIDANSSSKENLTTGDSKKTNNSTVTSPSKPQPETKPKSGGNTTQSQIDKQALALLSKLNSTGTMPSAAEMRRLNSLRSGASADVQRRIDAFNAKWDW